VFAEIFWTTASTFVEPVELAGDAIVMSYVRMRERKRGLGLGEWRCEDIQILKCVDVQCDELKIVKRCQKGSKLLQSRKFDARALG